MGFESEVFTWLGVLGLIYIGTLIERVTKTIGFYARMGTLVKSAVDLKEGLFR